MGNLTFRGYAQNKGFDPLKVPDETWKLQQETERSLRGMREVRDQNRANRSDQLQALQNNNAKEESQRNQNYNLLTDFKQAYHDAELQHYEIAIKNAETKEKEAVRQLQQFEKLKDLSATAFNAFKGFQQERQARIHATGKSALAKFASTHNIPEQVIQEGLYSQVGLIEHIKTVRPDLKTELGELVGFKGQAFQIAAVQRFLAEGGGADQMIDELAKTRKFTVDGKKMTIAEMKLDATDTKGANVQAAYNTIREEVEQGLLNQYTPYFNNKYVRPGMDQKFGLLRKAEYDRVAANRTEKEQKDDALIIQGLLDTESVQKTLQTMISDQSTTKGVTIGKIEKQIKAAFKENLNGKYGQAKKAEIFDSPVTDHNGKTVRFGDWRNDLETEVDTILAARYQQEQTVDKVLLNQVKVNAAQRLAEAELKDGGRASAASIQTIREQASTEHHNQIAVEEQLSFLTDYENREPLDVETADKFLKLKADKKILSIKDLAHVPATLKAKYDEQTIEAYGLEEGAIESAYDGIKLAIAEVAGELGDDNRSWQVVTMMNEYGGGDWAQFARNELSKKEYLNADGTVNGQAALNAARANYVEHIKQGKGIYSYEGLGSENFKFTFLQGKRPNTELQYIEQSLVDNRANLYNPAVFMNQGEIISDWAKAGGTGPVPAALHLAHSIVGKDGEDYFDVANTIIAARGEKRIDREGLAKVVEVVAPEVRTDVTFKPTKARTINSLIWTGEKNGNIPDMSKLISEMQISKEIYNFNPSDTYDVIRTTSGLDTASNIFNKNAQEFTLGEAYNAMNSSMFTEFGAFGLTFLDLERAEAKELIDTDTILTDVEQRNIFMDKSLDDTSVFYFSDMKEPIPNVGDYRQLPYNYRNKKFFRDRRKSSQQRKEEFEELWSTQLKPLLDEGADITKNLYNLRMNFPGQVVDYLYEIGAKTAQEAMIKAEQRKLSKTQAKEEMAQEIKDVTERNFYQSLLADEFGLDAFRLTPEMQGIIQFGDIRRLYE